MTKSHQTVRLARGQHASPDQGACVMELASMLAGEAFSDHPRSVSSTIAAFIRPYNDVVDRRRREGLYAWAAAVVGSRASRSVERARFEHVRRTLDELRGAPPRRRRPVWLPLAPGRRETIGGQLARTLATRPGGHERAVSLVDELIAIAGPADVDAPVAAPESASKQNAGSG